MALDLTLACGDYDLTRPLRDGSVQPDGIDLNLLLYPSPERHWRMLTNHEFDVCEMSLGSYLLSREDHNAFPFLAIPVFPHRRFRHSYMFKQKGSDLSTLNDLNNKTIGIKNWQNSAGIWMRGIAQDDGLDLKSVHWISDHSEDIPFTHPDRYNVTIRPEADIETLLEGEEIDGAMYPKTLDVEKVDRLFSDSMHEEIAYYKKTKIFPLMHTVVIHTDILETNPWVAINLYKAFCEARDVCLERIEDPRQTALAWARQHLEHQQSILGTNPWPHGLTPDNQRSLDTLLAYAKDQGLISTKYENDELFVESALKHDELARREAMFADT